MSIVVVRRPRIISTTNGAGLEWMQLRPFHDGPFVIYRGLLAMFVLLGLAGGIALGFSAAWVIFKTPSSDPNYVSTDWLQSNRYDKEGYHP